jgi:phospholipase C
MQCGNPFSATCRYFGLGAALLSTVTNLVAPPSLAAETKKRPATATPIQHVIVIIGENRTFDHVFATYRPPIGQKVDNLLSKGIIKADGTPGPNFNLATQYRAGVYGSFQLSPKDKTAYEFLPPTNTQGTPTAPSDAHPAPFQTIAAAELAEPGLLPADYGKLTTGASGLAQGVVDTRIANVYHLKNGPYPLTPSVPYDAYAGSPVHRFYQMWQQLDCNEKNATKSNPSGCLADLFPWVEVIIGTGSNGNPRPKPFNYLTTHEGAISMQFFNVQHGDAPYLTSLAETYTLSDNMHQAVMGGTGANHIMLGSGTAFAYTDGKGNLAVPPTNEIENPNPQPGTNNWYTQDGYSGGSYSDCSDHTQPGVKQVFQYLNSLPYKTSTAICQPSAYYLLNNYNPGYFGDGSVNTTEFTIPPTPQITIADSLDNANINWKYYGDGWNLYVEDPNYNNPWNNYCNICNFAQYTTSIMTDPTLRQLHLADVPDLYNDIYNGTLPPVSFVKPSGFTDGHPASSKLDLFEGFVKKIVTQVQANPTLWASTAIFITFDEGGGNYDSGYVQPIDFFGDGTRIPFIAVSPFSKGGKVDHTYYDHVSILKFIEKNWGLSPVTGYGRDNLPNPTAGPTLYVPGNQPAIGDLTNMFSFKK